MLKANDVECRHLWHGQLGLDGNPQRIDPAAVDKERAELEAFADAVAEK